MNNNSFESYFIQLLYSSNLFSILHRPVKRGKGFFWGFAYFCLLFSLDAHLLKAPSKDAHLLKTPSDHQKQD